MRRILLLGVILLNLLPMITDGFISTDALRASAQTYGNESFYECDDELGMFVSPIPCEGVVVYGHKCEKCGDCFETEDELDLHILSCHAVYECQYCYQRFYVSEYDDENRQARDNHEETCPSKLNDGGKPGNSEQGGNSTDGSGGTGGASGSGGMSGGGGYSSCQDDNNLNTIYCTNIPKEEFDKDLWKESDQIKQNGSTCSAAVIEKCLADLNPALFRRMALNLYLKGEYPEYNLSLSSDLNTYSYSDLVNRTNYGTNFVDLIMQDAFENKMNLMPYSPIYDFDQTIGKISGFQYPWRVKSMLELLDVGEVSVIVYPSFNDLKNINYDNNFVIALCRISSEDSDYDLHGSVYNLHYAQIIGIDDFKILYWSWGKNDLESAKDNTDRFLYLLTIKR